MALQLTSKRSRRGLLLAGTLFSIFAFLVQPLVTLNIPSAFASEQAVKVTEANMQGWIKYGNATPGYTFETDASALGGGALKMGTANRSDYIQLDRTIASSSTPVLASDIHLSYMTRTLSGVGHAAPAYVIAIDKDGDLRNQDDTFWAWYEPAYNDSGTEVYANWNEWNITADSKFWYNGASPAEAKNYTSLRDALVSLPNAKVTGFTLNMGTGNAGWSALVDKVVTTEATYDFQVAATPVIESISVGAQSNYLSGSNQRIGINVRSVDDVKTGNLQLNQVIADGQAPSNANKIVYPFQKDTTGWYVAVDTTKLQDGAKYLYKIEAHGYGTPHGYYGNNSAWQYPNYYFVVDNTAPAKVENVAFYGKDNKKLTGYTNNATVVVKWNEVADAQKYEYCYYNDVATSPYREQNCYRTYPTANQQAGVINQGEGTHYVKVRAIDAAGNAGSWSESQFVIYDVTSPDAQLSASNMTPISTESVTVTGEVVDEQNIKSHWFEITAPDKSISYVTNMNTANKSHAFSLNTSKGAGEYKVRYVATDRAGNRSDSPNATKSEVITVVVAKASDEPIGFNDPDGETPLPDESETDSTQTGGSSSTDTGSNDTRSVSSSASADRTFALAPSYIPAVNDGQVATTQPTDENTTTDVLGTSTTEDDKGEVAGASDKAGWSLADFAKNWWFAILAVVIVLWLLIAAVSRRIRGANAA